MLSISTFVTIVGLALTIVGIVIAVYYGRRSLRQNKRELKWSTETIPVLNQEAESYREVIRITIGGREVFRNLYLTRLRIQNTGKQDIESSMFDQGRPLIFTLAGQKDYHIIESGAPAIKATSDSIRIGPELLPSGEFWVLSFLTEQQPQVRLTENYLPNVDIREITRRTREDDPSATARIASYSAIISALIAAVTTIIAALLSR